jgi:hypothetical protein
VTTPLRHLDGILIKKDGGLPLPGEGGGGGEEDLQVTILFPKIDQTIIDRVLQVEFTAGEEIMVEDEDGAAQETTVTPALVGTEAGLPGGIVGAGLPPGTVGSEFEQDGIQDGTRVGRGTPAPRWGGGLDFAEVNRAGISIGFKQGLEEEPLLVSEAHGGMTTNWKRINKLLATELTSIGGKE